MTELVGLIVPFFIDFINRRVTNSDVRFWISMGVCALIGVALNYSAIMAGSVEEVAKSASLVFASAQLTYKLYWEKSNLRENLNLKAQ